jgi:two-component system chemotaxis response regulator CheY
MPQKKLSEIVALLIDDEYFIRATMRQLLYQLGILDVQEAADGASGLMQVKVSEPDIIFCDIHMPVLDGLTFVRELRATSQIPVVMLTSDQAEKSVVMAKNLKVNGYLVKPVSFAAVQRAVERALKPAPAR